MLDTSHRVVVEQDGSDVRYTPRPGGIRFKVRLPMDSSSDGEVPRKGLRPPEARS